MADGPDPRYGADGRTYEECIQARDKLAEAESTIGESFDKHLLTLASGALGLTLLFVEKVAPDPEWKILLLASWITLAGCILVCLLAIITAQQSFIRLAEINKALYDIGADQCDTSNRYADRTSRLNWAALISFMAGVLLFVFFAMANQKGSFMSKPQSHPPSQATRPAADPGTRAPQGVPIVTPKVPSNPPSQPSAPKK